MLKKLSPNEHNSVSDILDRPLRVMFLLTSMPIGGAETLLVNLIRRADPERFEPMVACMKQMDVLGEQLSKEIPVFENLINHKYDVAKSMPSLPSERATKCFGVAWLHTEPGCQSFFRRCIRPDGRTVSVGLTEC